MVPRKVKEAWIKAKYVDRLFLAKISTTHSELGQVRLYSSYH